MTRYCFKISFRDCGPLNSPESFLKGLGEYSFKAWGRYRDQLSNDPSPLKVVLWASIFSQQMHTFWVLPEDYCKKDPCNFNTERYSCQKVDQPMSNSWSTCSQPDFVRAFCRRTTARNRQGKILYTELFTSWPTLGQLLANSPPYGKLQGSSLQ